MRFKTFINESLDSPPARFKEDVERHPADNTVNVVRYDFFIGLHSMIRVTFRLVDDHEWEMALSRNGAHGIDGDLKGTEATTTALRMYSTVVKIFESFTTKYMSNKDVIMIDSWEGIRSSQAALYDTMVRKLKHRYPKLSITSYHGGEHRIRKINESWDSPVPYEMKQFLRDEVRFKFKIDDTFYVAAIAQLKKSDGVSSRYSLEFGIARDQSSPMSSWAYSFPKEVDRDIKHTNHVYSTFLKGVYEYFDKIKLGKNDDIVFSAYNEYSSQSRLYHALSRRIAKHLGFIVAQSGNSNWLKHPDHPKLKILSPKPPVNEMFASPLPWTTNQFKSPTGYRNDYYFSVGEKDYVVEIYDLPLQGKVAASTLRYYDIAYGFAKPTTSKYRTVNYERTGATPGTSYSVLSTVNAIIEDFFMLHPLQKGDRVGFAASEANGSQEKFYTHVAERFKKKYHLTVIPSGYGGYTFEK